MKSRGFHLKHWRFFFNVAFTKKSGDPGGLKNIRCIYVYIIETYTHIPTNIHIPSCIWENRNCNYQNICNYEFFCKYFDNYNYISFSKSVIQIKNWPGSYNWISLIYPKKRNVIENADDILQAILHGQKNKKRNICSLQFDKLRSIPN